jgi:hypothetical protein
MVGIDLKNPLHEFGQVRGFSGLNEEMDVVGHQAVVENTDREFFYISLDDFLNLSVIIIALKYVSPVISSGEDVIISLVYDMSCSSRHFDRLPNYRRLFFLRFAFLNKEQYPAGISGSRLCGAGCPFGERPHIWIFGDGFGIVETHRDGPKKLHPQENKAFPPDPHRKIKP